MATIRCEPCGKNFTGQVCYQQHVESEKHKRKILNYAYFNGSSEASPQCPKSFESVLKNSEPSPGTFECPVCNIIFNSLSNFQTHSISAEHALKVIAKNSQNSESSEVCRKLNHFSNCEESSSNKTVHEGPNDNILPPIEIMKSQSFAVCKTCNKAFSGPEPYKQHIVSAAHLKKVELEKNGIVNLNTAPFICSPCDKKFSGEIPYMQHMESEIHKKKMLSIQFLEKNPSEINSASGVKDSKVDENNQNISWFCNICQIKCSGLIPYKQHLEGLPHLKKAKRQNLNLEAVASEQIPLQNKTVDTLDASCIADASDIQINNGSENMDVSYVLPDMEGTLKVEDLEKSVKIFLPNDSIDFDNPIDKIDINTPNEEIPTAKNGQMHEVTENLSDYEKCDICEVDLKSKKEALDHFQSLEHFSKKDWQ